MSIPAKVRVKLESGRIVDAYTVHWLTSRRIIHVKVPGGLDGQGRIVRAYKDFRNGAPFWIRDDAPFGWSLHRLMHIITNEP